MTDLERVTRMAEECGAYTHPDGIHKQHSYEFTPEEIEHIREAVMCTRVDYAGELYKVIKLQRTVESLQAKLAMQAEALKRISGNNLQSNPCAVAEQTLNATQADVDAFMAKKKAEWEKGVLEEAKKEQLDA